MAWFGIAYEISEHGPCCNLTRSDALYSCKIFSLTWVGSLFFSSLINFLFIEDVQENQDVYHILLIDNFYVDLKHYKPFQSDPFLIDHLTFVKL